MRAPAVRTRLYGLECGLSRAGAARNVTGRDVVPSARYEVRQLAASCQGNEASCTAVSSALTINTQRWGDIVAPFQNQTPGVNLTQPNIADIGAAVDKFKGIGTAPILARADVQPGILNNVVNISDIGSVVDAFKGFAYPLPAHRGRKRAREPKRCGHHFLIDLDSCSMYIGAIVA